MQAVLSIVFGVIYVALLIVFLAMWARFVFDWIQALNRGWRPKYDFSYRSGPDADFS